MGKKVTRDTAMCLGDIMITCDLLRKAVEHINAELAEAANEVADPEAFEKLIEDITRKLIRQMSRLQQAEVRRG